MPSVLNVMSDEINATIQSPTLNATCFNVMAMVNGIAQSKPMHLQWYQC